jgi:hypothetical protein
MQDVFFIPNTLESQTRTWQEIISGQVDEADSSVGQLSHTARLSLLADPIPAKLTDKFGSIKYVFATPGKHGARRVDTAAVRS